MLNFANLGPSIFLVLFTITLLNMVRLLQNFLHIVPHTTWTNAAYLITVWSLFVVYAYIVAKPYVPTYGLATIYAHTNTQKVEIVK